MGIFQECYTPQRMQRSVLLSLLSPQRRQGPAKARTLRVLPESRRRRAGGVGGRLKIRAGRPLGPYCEARSPRRSPWRSPWRSPRSPVSRPSRPALRAPPRPPRPARYFGEQRSHKPAIYSRCWAAVGRRGHGKQADAYLPPGPRGGAGRPRLPGLGRQAPRGPPGPPGGGALPPPRRQHVT